MTLVFGILGITFSTVLIASPNQTKNFSDILNRSFNVDEKLSFLDKDIDISGYFYDHHIWAGLLLVVGSSFAFTIFYVSLDITILTKILVGSQTQMLWGEILFGTILWIGKITCLAGILCGSLLLLAPQKMKQLENKLNTWFETKVLFKKLDQTSHNIDSLFFRYPLPVGITGAVLSFLILCLSIINLLD